MYVHLLVGGGFKGIFVEVLKCSFNAEQSFWPFWGKMSFFFLTCTRRTPSPGPSCWWGGMGPVLQQPRCRCTFPCTPSQNSPVQACWWSTPSRPRGENCKIRVRSCFLKKNLLFFSEMTCLRFTTLAHFFLRKWFATSLNLILSSIRAIQTGYALIFAVLRWIRMHAESALDVRNMLQLRSGLWDRTKPPGWTMKGPIEKVLISLLAVEGIGKLTGH